MLKWPSWRRASSRDLWWIAQPSRAEVRIIFGTCQTAEGVKRPEFSALLGSKSSLAFSPGDAACRWSQQGPVSVGSSSSDAGQTGRDRFNRFKVGGQESRIQCTRCQNYYRQWSVHGLSGPVSNKIITKTLYHQSPRAPCHSVTNKALYG